MRENMKQRILEKIRRISEEKKGKKEAEKIVAETERRMERREREAERRRLEKEAEYERKKKKEEEMRRQKSDQKRMILDKVAEMARKKKPRKVAERIIADVRRNMNSRGRKISFVPENKLESAYGAGEKESENLVAFFPMVPRDIVPRAGESFEEKQKRFRKEARLREEKEEENRKKDFERIRNNDWLYKLENIANIPNDILRIGLVPASKIIIDLLDIKNIPITEALLKNSLQSYPSNIYYGNSSDVANKIRSSREFHSHIVKLVSEAEYKNLTSINHIGNLEFNSGDLFFAFHGFDGGVRVVGKKTGNTWYFKIKIQDRWDFHWKLFNGAKANALNGAGIFFQAINSIKNFNTTIEFGYTYE